MKIGIRREDKSPWEARVPLVPMHIAELVAAGIEVKAQPSEQRVYTDAELLAAGAVITEDLSDCGVILGVKEIPTRVFERDKTYVFFSHTIKGQSYNMPMLRRMMELRCNLIDYERIVDDEGRRLVSFSRFAGMAGMIDTLWIYGRRLAHLGRPTPLLELKQALAYPSLRDAQAHLHEVARQCSAPGSGLGSVVIGLTGMGRVARGALEVARHLEPSLVPPDRLGEWPLGSGFHLVIFDVADLVERVDGGAVDTQEYRAHPERYRSAFPRSLPHLDLLVNGIYWEPKYPRLVTREDVLRLYRAPTPPRLSVIGDVSCDIEGSIEVTVRACDPGHPCYVFDVDEEAAVDGIEGRGPVIMATDILPTELPREASFAFSETLVELAPALAGAHPALPLNAWGLPLALERAVILHHGALTPEYAYLQPAVDAVTELSPTGGPEG